MKDKIRNILEDVLPLVDFDSDFLFSELDSRINRCNSQEFKDIRQHCSPC